VILGPFETFWIYVILFFLTSLGTIEIAWLLSSRKKEPEKYKPFEAGQKMDVIPNQVGLFGSIRYFAYAMAFFVLDAFVWILFASLSALKVIPPFAALVLFIYISVLLVGLWYYIIRVLEVYRG